MKRLFEKLPHPVQQYAKKLRRWLFTGIVVLFFFGLRGPLFNFGKAGLGDLWDTLFEAVGITLYTNTVPLVAGLFATIVVAITLGAVLDWRPTKRALTAIPFLGNLFGLTISVTESIQDLKGMPAVLIETYDGLRQLGFISGFEPIRSWRLSATQSAEKDIKHIRLFGVALNLMRDAVAQGIRFRVYYPDFPFIVNGRGGWAEARRIECLLNPFEEIFARLVSAGFATRLKTGEPVGLADEDWDSLGLDVATFTESELTYIVAQSKKCNPLATK